MCSCHVVNEPKNTDDPVTNKLRKAFVHRALWMGLILKELKDRGLNWKELVMRQSSRPGVCMARESKNARRDR